MMNLTINGRQLTVPDNATILDAARRNEIYIPTLCDDPRLEPHGGCRLCLVQVKGLPRLVSACTTPATSHTCAQVTPGTGSRSTRNSSG